MTSRDVLIDALDFKSGKVPVDFGSTAVTGIHVSVVEMLRKQLGLKDTRVKVHEPNQMLGFIDDDLKEAIGIDTNGVFPYNTSFGVPIDSWKEWRTPWGQDVLIPGKIELSVKDDGTCFVFPQGDRNVDPSAKMTSDAFFFDAIIRQNNFNEDNLNPLDNTEEFTHLSETDLNHFKKKLAESQKSQRATIVNFGGTSFGDIARIPGTGLKNPKGIRDIEEWYISTLTRQDYIHKVFERQLELALSNFQRVFEVLDEDPDIIYICGTDFGTQNSLFCSPETFDSLYSPYYKKINEWIHKNTKSKTMKHCCGSIRKLIPNLIDAGFDILNPVQISADDMDLATLKQDFGKSIVFWGGGVDTQHTLPFSSSDDVYREVVNNCEKLAQGGGFVFNTVHNIQANTPIENVMAMINAIKDFNDT